MIGRDRRYGRGRQVSLKAKAGIAAAVLVGGGAIGVAAAASSHSSTAASNAGYSQRLHAQQQWQWQQANQARLLNLILTSNNWNNTFARFSQLNTMRTFTQVRFGHQVLAAQRGVVLFANTRFAVVVSQNGSLHLWRLSGNTKFAAATTLSSTNAALANLAAARLAMAGSMNSAFRTAGNFNTVNSMVTPTARTQTVTINVTGTGVVVQVSVANTGATIRTTTNGVTNTVFGNAFANAFTNAQMQGFARGSAVVIAGTRTGGFLNAQSVVFVPTTANVSTGTGFRTGTSVGGSTTCTTSAPCSGVRS